MAHSGLFRTTLRIAACLLILAALCGGVQAGTGTWTANGPFATGLGNKVVYALAVSPDGSIVYCGTGSGSVFSFTLPATEPVMTTVPTVFPTTVSAYVAPPSGGDDFPGGTGGNTGTGGQQQTGQNRLAPPDEEGTPVNVGGSTPVASATVYGSGNSGAVVTATPMDGPGAGVSPAPGSSVYSYVEISPAHTGTVTGAEITFTVSQSWLDEHHHTPQDIVMYHNVGGQWVALPTTVVKTANGQVYFSAMTPSFSLFAIGAKQGAVPVTTTAVPEKTFGNLAVGSTPVQGVVQAPAHPAAAPQPTATAAPAPAAPDSGFPLATVALIGAGCVVLIGSGWYVRRWYIRRQNPALFRGYD